MSVTIGATSGLPDPSSKGAEGETEESSEVTEMSDGSLRKDTIARRTIWNYTWIRYSAEAADIQAAILAAIDAVTVTFKPWDTTTTYTVEVVKGSHRWRTKPVINDVQWTISARFREV